MSVQASQERKITSTHIKWAITIICTVLVLCIPVNDVFTSQMKYFFAITLFNIFLLAFSLLPLIVPALLLPMGYWIFQVAEPSIIYGSWGNQIAWVVLGGLIFANMMTNSGLSKRIAYKCMTLARGNFVTLMFILLIPGIIITPFVPAAVARCAIFCTILMSLCQAMGYDAYSPKAVIAFVVGYIVSINTSYLFLTGTNANLIAVGFLENVGISVSFGRFFICNFVPSLLWLIASIILVFFLNRTKAKDDKVAMKKHLDQQYRSLGKMTATEKKMLTMMIVVMVLLLTSNYHSLNAGMIFCVAIAVGFLPGINLIKQTDLQKVNFTMVFLVTACVAIGDVATALGAGELLMNVLMPYAPDSFGMMSIFVWIITVLGNLLMTPLAIISSLSLPVITLAQNFGINPEAIIYIFLFSTNAVILPYEVAAGMVFFGFGMINTKQFMKNLGAIGLLSLISIFIFYIPWFKIIGLI